MTCMALATKTKSEDNRFLHVVQVPFLWDTKILESRIRCDITERLLPFGVQLRCRVARTKGMFSLYFLYNFLVFFLLLKEYFTRRSTNGKDVETQFIFLEISI